jgi:hypothetical protein
LFFAGEAVSMDYFGTTHGAWQTGEKAAIKVVKALYRERATSRKVSTYHGREVQASRLNLRRRKKDKSI